MTSTPKIPKVANKILAVAKMEAFTKIQTPYSSLYLVEKLCSQAALVKTMTVSEVI
ncbi:MAG: hypothetical protein F6K51_01585 [Moorea sp. SIO3I8]|nr:hypothetical protein [Moorena sp. SIO3I8]